MGRSRGRGPRRRGAARRSAAARGGSFNRNGRRDAAETPVGAGRCSGRGRPDLRALGRARRETEIALLFGVGDLQHLHFLAVLARPVHLEDLGRRARPASRHPRLHRGFLDRIVPAAGEGADLLGVTGTLAHHEAGGHSVRPGRPVLAGHVVVAHHAVAGERRAHHRGTQVLDEHATIEHHLACRGTGILHGRPTRIVPALDLEIKSWHDAGGPAMEDTGTATRKMMLDGRVLIEDLSSSMMGTPFTGHGMMGYDNVSGKYWSTWTDTMSTGLMVSQGSCDPQKVCTFTGGWNDPIKKTPVKARMTTRWTSPTTEVFEMYGPGKDGKEMKMMEITYTKK